MTKSKFKYSTANAGATLFQPKKESKPFAPFDIQAAGQHIIAAKEQNMRTELGNIKRTGDEGAEDFDIEQKNRLIVEQQNAYVEKINDQYDLDQWASFSKGAEALLTQGLALRQKQKKEAGLANLTEYMTTRPNEYKEWVESREAFNKANDKAGYDAWTKAFVLKSQDPILAAKVVQASGIEQKIISQQILADRITAIPENFKKELSTTLINIDDVVSKMPAELKASVEASGIFTEGEHLTYDQFVKKVHGSLKNTTIPDWGIYLDNIYRGKASGAILKSFEPGEIYDYGTILSEVRPVINKVADEGAFKRKQEIEKHDTKALSYQESSQVHTILKKGAFFGAGYTTQKLADLVDGDWEGMPGKDEAEKRKNSMIRKLDWILKAQAKGEPWANVVEISGIPLGKVKTRGSKKELPFSTVYARALEESGFINKALEVSRAQHGFKKDSRENGKKVILEAARKNVELTGSMSETQVQELAKFGASKGYGTQSELALAIRNELPTDLGRSIEQWTDKIKVDQGLSNDGKLYKEDYPGAPPQVFEQEGIKDFFHDKPKHALPRKDKETKITYFGGAIAGQKRQYEADSPLTIQERWSGIKAYRDYKLTYERLLGEKRGQEINPADLREEARSLVEAKILKSKGNEYYTEERPDSISSQVKQNNIHHKQLLSSPNGRGDSVVFSGTRERIEHVAKLQADNPDVPLHILVPESYMFENKDGIMVKFHDKTWENLITLSKAGGSTRLMLMQLNALNKEKETNQPLPLPAHAGAGGQALKKLYTTEDPNHSKALINIKSGENLINKPLKTINPETFFTEGLGVNIESLESALAESGLDLKSFFTKFTKELGLKESDIMTKVSQNQMRIILFNQYPEAYPDITKDSLDKPLPIIWPSILDPGFTWNTMEGV